MSIQKVDLQEFDQEGLQTIEVKILWGNNPLAIYHVDKRQQFILTDSKIKTNSNYFVVGTEILGDLNQVSIIDNTEDRIKFTVFENSILEINGVIKQIKDMVSSGEAFKAGNLYHININPQYFYSMKIGKLTIAVKQVTKAKKLVYKKSFDREIVYSSIASVVAASALIITTHLLVGTTNNDLLQQVNEDDRLNDIRAFIQRQRERLTEEQPQSNNSQQGAAASQSHSGPNGQMGSRQAPARNARHAIRNNGEPPHLSRQAARDMVASRGIFVALGARGALAGASSGITSPFGGLTESGLESQNANGNMNGDTINDAFGYGGLGNAGTGFGANGNGEGVVGVGNLQTNGIGGNGNNGYGTNRGSRLGNRGTRGPIVRPAAPNVIGLLSPESIRRVVIRNLPQVIHCHEQGLVQNPALEGRVIVRFVIGGEGTVMGSNIAESNIVVPSVGQCISNAVRRWQFPIPEGGGIVTVNYPFNLQRPE
jgi:hypothetical protein